MTEDPANTGLLVVTAGPAVIVVVRRGSAPLARGGLSPGRRVQHEVFVRVDAVAVRIPGEEWNARHAVDERALEEHRAQIVLRRGDQNRQPAGVAQNAADLPTPGDG